LRGKISTKETINRKKGEKIGENLGLSYGIHYLKTRLESMEGRELI